MPLIYALISRTSDVLAEYTSAKGNFSTVTRVLLKKIPPDDARLSYIYDEHIFHYVVSDGLTYLCMTDRNFDRQVSFKFLTRLQERFIDTYGDRGKTAIAYSLNGDFQRIIKQEMEQFNNNLHEHDKIAKVQHQLREVKEIMVKNIDAVLERGEKIEILVEKTEVMEQHAFKFNRSAVKLRKKMCWQDWKLKILIVVVLLVVFYALLAWGCGGMDLKPNCA